MVQDLIASMEPGQRYSAKGVGRLLRATLPNAQFKVRSALNERVVRKSTAPTEARN